MIRNLVFDMGGVLLRFDNPVFIRNAGVTDPEDIELLIREVYGCADWPLLDWGIIDENILEQRVRKKVPERLHHVLRKLIAEWSSPILPVPGMADLIREYKEKGYRVYLLSNVSLGFHGYWNDIPGSEYFDGFVISAEEKCIKPDPAIYKILLERFGLKAEECLFTDDISVNVAAAKYLGMEGIVFRGDVDRFRNELEAALSRSDPEQKPVK